MVDPQDFTGITFTVKQADTLGRLEVRDTFQLTTRDGQTFLMVCRKPDGTVSQQAELQWNADQVCFEGPYGPKSQTPFVAQLSVYEQGGEFPMKVVYGVTVDKDPQSVGAMAADDQAPPPIDPP